MYWYRLQIKWEIKGKKIYVYCYHPQKTSLFLLSMVLRASVLANIGPVSTPKKILKFGRIDITHSC
jgi:hypothetical protein